MRERRFAGIRLEPRKLLKTRLPQDQRWAGRGAQCALYVHSRGHPLQSADPGSIPAITETWQGKESSSHGLYAQVPHHPQCHAARPATFSLCLHRVTSLHFPT
jgi:hypothetical protein